MLGLDAGVALRAILRRFVVWCWLLGLSLDGVLGVGGLFDEVASLGACVQIRVDYRATSLVRGAFAQVITCAMLTSLPFGQRTVCGFSGGVDFWGFWEIARVNPDS